MQKKCLQTENRGVYYCRNKRNLDLGYVTENQFARIVKMEMQRKSISLRTLAGESGISPGYLSLVLNGERNPPQPEIIERMSHVLGLKIPVLHMLAGYIPANDPEWAKFFNRIRRMDDNQIDNLMDYVKNLSRKR